MKISDLAKLHARITKAVHTYRGSLRRLRPSTLEREARTRLDQMKAENDAESGCWSARRKSMNACAPTFGVSLSSRDAWRLPSPAIRRDSFASKSTKPEP